MVVSLFVAILPLILVLFACKRSSSKTIPTPEKRTPSQSYQSPEPRQEELPNIPMAATQPSTPSKTERRQSNDAGDGGSVKDAGEVGSAAQTQPDKTKTVSGKVVLKTVDQTQDDEQQKHDSSCSCTQVSEAPKRDSGAGSHSELGHSSAGKKSRK